LAGIGGIGVADLDGDCLFDYVISYRASSDNGQGLGNGIIEAYSHYGKLLWKKVLDLPINGNSELFGLPGWNGKGFSTADINLNGNSDVIHLNSNNEIVIRHGINGNIQKKIPVSLPAGATSWGHVQVVNLRGKGDLDLIVQANPIPFKWLKAVNAQTGSVLWSHNNYVGQKHGGFRAADIDNDGRDEVLGVTLIDHNGSKMNSWSYPRPISVTAAPHIDSIFFYDVRPDIPGIEVILLEESGGSDSVSLLNKEKIIWRKNNQGQEPQNAAIGNFDLSKPGLETWCRSRYNTDQRPWVFDAKGNVISEYILNNKKPSNWTTKGIDEINAIDWSGDGRELIVAKERHTNGKVALMDPITGQFIKVWNESAARLFVVDVTGDHREEIVVFNQNNRELRVYFNETTSNGMGFKKWLQPRYKRAKDNYNYYSP
jgi:hypothetical protein